MNWKQPGAVEIAYLAGFFDGEGCISFAFGHSKPSPLLCVTNTQQPIIEVWHEVFGFGRLYERQASHGKTYQHHQTYRWIADGAIQVERTLRTLLPYLVVKAEQARLMIEYCELPSFHPSSIRFGYAPDLPRVLRERMRLIPEILSFNSGGRQPDFPKHFAPMIELLHRYEQNVQRQSPGTPVHAPVCATIDSEDEDDEETDLAYSRLDQRLHSLSARS